MWKEKKWGRSEGRERRAEVRRRKKKMDSEERED